MTDLAPRTARLLELVELQHRTIETYNKVLGERFGVAKPVFVGPRLDVQATPRIQQSSPTAVEGQQSWWPAKAPLPAPMLPPPGLGCATLYDRSYSSILVLVLGLEGDDLEKAVAMISNLQRLTMNFSPVFATDSSEHAAFIQRGFLYEYLAQGIYRSSGRLIDCRVKERIGFLKQKWSVDTVLNLSAPNDLGRD